MSPRVLFLIVLVFLPSAFAADRPHWTGDRALAAAELEAQWSQVADPSRPSGIRGLLRFALEAAGLGWHPERITAAIRRARSLQDLDPSSATRGNFRWRSSDAGVLDRNGVEFATQLAAFLRLRFADALNAEGRMELDQLLADAIHGLRGHEVRLEYTNIYVMKTWGLMATGEALGRPDVASDGYERFDTWLRHTARHGLGEYGAVTYYGIDLDSLVLIARHAGRPDIREKALAAIRLLWTDIAANWWAPGDRLGGANSRSYDYLFGRGYLEAHTWTAGWLRERPQLEGAGWLSGPHDNLTVLRDAVTFRPPADWTEDIRGTVPRSVVQQWGTEPYQQAVHWVGRHVSLASSGASRGSDERTLVANLGDSPAVAQVTLFMDGRGDPFGTRKVRNAANQAKALHLTPLIATVQRGPEVLQLLSDEPLGPKSRHRPGELSCFLSHLTVPREAEVWVNGAVVRPGSTTAPTVLPPHATLALRLGAGAVAVRLLLATDTNGQAARLEYVDDSPSSPARRITVVHSDVEPRGRGTVLVWLRARDDADTRSMKAWIDDFAARPVALQVGADSVRVEASGLTGPLVLGADLRSGTRTERTGAEPAAVLSVNGRDLGRALLQAYRND